MEDDEDMLMVIEGAEETRFGECAGAGVDRSASEGGASSEKASRSPPGAAGGAWRGVVAGDERIWVRMALMSGDAQTERCTASGEVQDGEDELEDDKEEVEDDDEEE
jgi:hypothetical protein